MSGQYRRVGAARPSHLMFTGGIGALIDLPNFSVIVKGLEAWNHTGLPGEHYLIDEPRLRAAVNRRLRLYGADRVDELRSPPWAEGGDNNPQGPAAQHTGVPVTPFPQWMRCTACNELAALDSGSFELVNRNPRTPHEARFVHDCKRRGTKPLAVAARFTLVCRDGHLDEFPYVFFAHGGTGCPKAERPRMRMRDNGGNQAANVTIECIPCGAHRNIRHAMGERGRQHLPRCRGRHPHLDTFAGGDGCSENPLVLVAGASNQWFPITLTALALPAGKEDDLRALVESRWAELNMITSTAIFQAMSQAPHYRYLNEYDAQEVVDAVNAHHLAQSGKQPESTPADGEDLLTPEWQLLTSAVLPRPTEDFALEQVDVPEPLRGLFADVRQVERLREARALIGFTRLDAPDPEDPELVRQVSLSTRPRGWVPAGEVRGEGIFLRVQDTLVADWAARMETSDTMHAHRDAYAQFRTNRRSRRIPGGFHPMDHWPGARYIALHTLSHMLIRTIALECGYSSASLGERIYAGTDTDPRTGILIYTAVPDAEGTLGGLVTLAGERHFERIVRRALGDAAHCSSDPLCAERVPQKPFDYLHGAACHACLFVSETTCERGNRYLDRRYLVPLGGDPADLLTPRELVE
ncbi:DrmB family protein [Streptomyces sp. DSM 116494]|uniref:DrmB family protein n=1 Tax=Streptomyces TaxID=1883 RepID=UPI0036A6BAF0